MMYLGENNGKLSETKRCYLSQLFLKMRKFLLDMRKDFLIMSNFYLVEILSEQISLTIATNKKILKTSNYVLILIIFFLIMRIRNLQCTEWNKLSLEIRNSEWYSIFKKSLLKFIRTIPNSVFRVADIYGIKLLTRLRAGLSHLREYKFSHNFQDTINPLCSCSLEIESISHCLLRCQNFMTPTTNPMKKLRKLDSPDVLNLDKISLTKLLLCGDSEYENNVNKKILLAFINFILSTKRFEGQLMWRFP